MKIPLEELASMALFAQVVRLRSFTAAARDAGLAKSAVSKRISGLEARLGVRLLVRTTRKLGLTEEGLRYYQHCAALLAAADAAEESVAGARTGLRGVVRINAPVTLAQMFLARACAGLLARAPELEIELVADDRLVDVVEGGFDIVVRVGRPADSSVVARRLAVDRLVVAGAPAYLAARGRPTTPDELLAHECLHYTLVPQPAEWRFRGPRGRFSVPVHGRFAASDGTVLREAAIAGAGLAVMPLFMAARDLEAGRLELVLEGARRAEIAVHALLGGRQVPARTRAVVDHLVRWFAADDWRTRG